MREGSPATFRVTSSFTIICRREITNSCSPLATTVRKCYGISGLVSLKSRDALQRKLVDRYAVVGESTVCIVPLFGAQSYLVPTTTMIVTLRKISPSPMQMTSRFSKMKTYFAISASFLSRYYFTLYRWTVTSFGGSLGQSCREEL